MSAQRQLLPVVAITGSSMLVGCGGGYPYAYGGCGPYGGYCGCGGYYASSYGCSYGGAGIYEGTLTASHKHAIPVVALVPESGPTLLSAQDGSFYRLNVATSAGVASGSYRAFSMTGGLPNGSPSDSGSASLLASAKALNARALEVTLADQQGNEQSLDLTLDTRYKAPPPSGALVGTWYNPTANGVTVTLSIDADGSLSGNDSDGCTYTGNVNSVNRRLNVLETNFTRDCASGTVRFAGLVSYLPSPESTPAELQFMADDPNGDYLALLLQPG
jgi:hypothetical protein